MQRTGTIESVFRIYRLVLSGLFAAAAIFTSDSNILFDSDSPLFIYVSIAWFLAVLAGTLLTSKFPNSSVANTLNLTIDIAALAILSWINKGLASGIYYLMLPSAAMAGLVLNIQLSLLIAAIGSLSILAGQLNLFLSNDVSLDTLFPTGLLGAMLFASTMAFKVLEQRLTKTETRAKLSDAKAVEYQRLSEAVITQMLSGAIVIDENETITLANPSAEKMLATKATHESDLAGQNLSRFTELRDVYIGWKNNKSAHVETFIHSYSGAEIQPQFRHISQGPSNSTLIMLEDTQQVRQRAQQAKVFALGKLSTSLAHEVRNPLSAINQANDLLKDSPDLNDDQKKLVNIISRHCERMDKTIDVAHQLSRRLEPQIQPLLLQPWLKQFVSEYKESQTDDCNIHVKSFLGATISFDGQHLTQVLRNLVDNGLKFSQIACNKRDVAIHAREDEARRLLLLDVYDRGIGIPKDEVENIFAPFQSTSGSAGMGLYLCRELCEANFASINYLYKSDDQESGFFRVTAWIDPPNK